MSNKHPNLDNIRPHQFKPGQSGNPGGRLKGGVSLVAALRRYLTEHPEDVEAITQALVRMGKNKELGAIKEMYERVDGKVAETHRLEGDIPVRLVFEPASSEES